MLESTAAGLSLIAESVSITQKKYGEISRIVTSLEKFLLAKYEPEVVEGYAGYSGLIARCEQAKNASLTSVLTTLQGDEQREVTLLKPFSLKLAGSFRTLESATSINEKSADNCIDVEITLNGEMFSPADTINYRVSDKVNLVLCKVAEVMVQYAEMKTLVHDDWLFSMGLNSPAVILSLSGKDKAAYRFRLIPIIMDAEKSIKIHKFKPSKCCVRPQNSVVVSQTSIVHNASIARMLCATSVVKQINDVADATPAFNETLKVLKVWKNRRLSKCLITGFNLAAMLAHICRIKSQAASKASTLELLKLFLTASPSLHSSAVFGEASQGQSTQNCLADFSLWADEHMNYDLLWNMQPAWSEFRDECTRALKLVFDVELMCKRKSELCDLYLKSVRDVKLAAWNLGDDEAGSSQIFSLLGNLSHDLFYVMGTSQLRGTHVRLSQDGDKGVCSVVVGVNLQSANLKLQESTTVGPNADTAVETEITKFREFWGHKASLLSMPNGTSAWAVSWPAGSELGKDCMRETTKSFTPSVPTQILRWICQNRFNSLLKVCPSMSVTDIPSADSSIERELHDVVISLQSRLATLRNCGVKEVSQISSRMRYTDIPPQLCTKTKWSADDSGLTDEDASQGSGVNFRTCVVDSNIVLSGNMNKWKLGDEEWVRHAKIGCLLSIQEELRDTTEFRLSVINKNDPFLEVYAPLSDKRTVAVRLRICTPIDEWPESHWITKGLAPVPKNVEEEDLPRKISQAQFLWYAPWLHQQIEACQTKFPAFVGTVRLLKLFVGAQRLSWDRHDFFWELLTLGAFQNAIRSSGKEKSDRNDVVIHTPNVGFYEYVSTRARLRFGKVMFVRLMRIFTFAEY